MPVKPSTNLPTGGHSACPNCGHEREGFPALDGRTQRPLRKICNLEAPSCNSGFDMGFGDVDYCPCRHSSHAEHLVEETRYL